MCLLWVKSKTGVTDADGRGVTVRQDGVTDESDRVVAVGQRVCANQLTC